MKRSRGWILMLAAFLALVLPISTRPQSAVSQSMIDSLEAKLAAMTAGDTAMVSILKSLSKVYLFKDARRSALYAREAADAADRLKLPEDPMILVALGRAYSRFPDNEQSLRYFEEALSAASRQKDTSMMAWAHIYTGHYYYNLRNIPPALYQFDRAISIGEQLQDSRILSEAWFGKALVYNIFEELPAMYNAMRQYLIYADTAREQRRISDARRLIGTYFRSTGQFREAIEANSQAFDVAASVNDSILMGAALNHMAWYYYELDSLEKSLGLYKKNLTYYNPASRNDLANVYGNIGNIYRDWKRYPEAIENYNKSIELSKKNHDFYNLSWLYGDISKLYEQTGDYRQAYENQVLATMYGDSLASMTYQQTLAGTRAQYEAEKTAKELELMSMKLQRNRLLVWVLVGAFGLVALTALLIISRYRFKSRQRIQAMNHKISELNQTNLRQQMNPHFIFNTLNSIQYYVFQNDKISSNNYMTKFASLIRKTLENSRHTEISIKEELDSLNLYLELEELRFKEKFEWSLKVDEEIDTLAYKIPTMLIQPYVENAITHGLMNKENGKGRLFVELKLHDDQIHCIIEDNGIGRARAMEIRQQKNGQHQSMGTNITESRLKLVNELYGKSMKVLYTDLSDSRGEPAGTRVEINIPIIT